MSAEDGLLFRRARERITERLPHELRSLRDLVHKRGLPLDGPMSHIIRGIRKEHALTDAECAALAGNRLFVHGLWYMWAYEVSPRTRGVVLMDSAVDNACLIVLLLKCIHDTPGPVGAGFCALLHDDRNKVLYNAMIEALLSCAHADADKARIRREYLELNLHASLGRVRTEFQNHGIGNE